MNREYAIINNEGEYLTYPNEHGSGRYIPLQTKDEAEREIITYYSRMGFSIKRMKVEEE